MFFLSHYYAAFWMVYTYKPDQQLIFLQLYIVIFNMVIELYTGMILFLTCRYSIWLFFKSVLMVTITPVSQFNIFNIFINSFQIFLQFLIAKSPVSCICSLSLMSLPHDDLYSFYGFFFSLSSVRATLMMISVGV